MANNFLNDAPAIEPLQTAMNWFLAWFSALPEPFQAFVFLSGVMFLVVAVINLLQRLK